MAYRAYVASENAPNRQAERYPFVFDAMAELKAKMPVGRDVNKVGVYVSICILYLFLRRHSPGTG